MSLSHRKARYYLQAAADGLLSAEALADLERHLADCAVCQAYATQLAQLERRLTRSLQARWPAPDPHAARQAIAGVQSQVGKRHWLRRVYDAAQAVAWAGLVIALVVAVAWLFRTVTPQLATMPDAPPSPTSMPPAPTTPPQAITETVTPLPAPTPEEERTLTVCLGQEPPTLYLYGGQTLAASHVHEAIYDGPIDSRNFSYQPVILEKLPGLSDGDAAIVTVTVGAGDRVVDANGQPVTLQAGDQVRPAGCYAPACAVAFDGTPLEMEQMVVTFTLKPGILWSDGEPLTAYDSLYSFELDQDPDTPTPKTAVDRTASYAASDDFTTVWSGLPGYRDPGYMLRFWTPLPEHTWGELTALELVGAQESSREPLGWGAYVIQEWVPGDHITLTRNENYWRAAEGLPRFSGVTYRFVGENASANLVALLTGECDIVDQTAQLESQAAMLLELQAVGKLKATFTTGNVWEHADFGIRPVPSYDRPDFFGDVRVRQAIAYCMDRQAVVDTALYGRSVVPPTYLPPEHPLYDPGVPQYPFDPQAGVALLEAAGWLDEDGDPGTPRVAQGVAGVPDGTPLAFNLSTTSASQRQQAARILQASLAECGVQVNLDYWSPGEFFANGPDGPLFGRQFDLAQFAWLTGVEPPCDLYLCAEIPSEENDWTGNNNTGFCDAAYDAACQAALQSLPGTPAYERYHKEAQRIFAEQLPVVPLYMRLKLAATRPDMQNFIMDPTAQSEFWNIESFDYGE